MLRRVASALFAIAPFGAACNAQAVPPATSLPQGSYVPACPPPRGKSTIAWMALVDRGVIAGRLVALNALEPVEGALVELVRAKRSALSAPDGRFRFESVQADEDSLRVRALGYVRATAAVRVTKEFGAMAFVVLVPLTSMDGCSDVAPRPPAATEGVPPAV